MPRLPRSSSSLRILAAVSAVLLGGVLAETATLPSGFSEQTFSGIAQPTGLAMAPDGRVFVAQQCGAIRLRPELRVERLCLRAVHAGVSPQQRDRPAAGLRHEPLPRRRVATPLRAAPSTTRRRSRSPRPTSEGISFSDYGGGWIRSIMGSGSPGTLTAFASGISGPTDVETHADGSPWYSARNSSAVRRITFGGPTPTPTEAGPSPTPTPTAGPPPACTIRPLPGVLEYKGGDRLCFEGECRDAGGILPPSALSSATMPYVVIPQPNATWSYSAKGIALGAVFAVIYDGKVEYGVFADTGPADIIGEASYAMATRLGINADPHTGGGEGPVWYIVFPGSKVQPVESHSDAVAKGRALARQFVNAN